MSSNREQYIPFPDNQYGMTEADPLGYEHLLVLFLVIAVGVGWSLIFVACEVAKSLWSGKKYLSEKMESATALKERRNSV